MEKLVVPEENGWKVSSALAGKNAILPILAAILLNKSSDEIILANVPRISDVAKMVEILRSLGAEITWSGSNMAVSTVILPGIWKNLMQEMRSTIFNGALLARFGQVCISHPRCAIGQRPIELHLKVYKN